jgi:hypothetical protein
VTKPVTDKAIVRALVALVAKAAFDITMVVPLNETTVVPDRIPVPEMIWPVATPLRLDTDVMDVLPEVTEPVGFNDTTMVVGPMVVDLMVVLPGMPVPDMGWPTTNCPVRFDSPVMFALPEATIPLTVPVLVPLALFDITMVALGAVPLDETTVVPEGMPVAPEMGWPTAIPVRLDTAVMLVLPVVTTPVVIWGRVIPETVVFSWMPFPEMGCPTTITLVSDPVMGTMRLPEVRLPVSEAAKLVAVAGTLIVRVLPMALEPTAVTVVLGGMPVPFPVMICPRTMELTLDTALRMLLPETVRP